MTYLVKIIGLDEETQQEVSAEIGVATSEQYNELLRRLREAVNAFDDWRWPGMFQGMHNFGVERTQGAPVKEAQE